MAVKKHNSILSFLLIVFLFASLLNVQVARADGETPTEPPAATEVVTEAPVESTPEPVESTPVPEEATDVPTATDVPEEPSSPEATAEETPVAGMLSDMPQDTNIIVLDEEGEPLALGSQETADAVVKSDPVWCPDGQFPGDPGCSTNYATITDLLTAMRTNPAAFAANGTIFLEHEGITTITTPLILTDADTSLSSSFATLSAYNLTVRGGWDSTTNDVSGTQAFFDQSYILIGSLANPWVGNIRLEDIEVRNTSVASSITVYTSSGNIVFDDVDVAEQTGDQHQVYLHSQTGNITVGNRSNFDGNDTGDGENESQGFYAETGGSITIDGTGNTSYTFRDNEGAAADTHNGAMLLAPTVTLINVISRANDGNGIEIIGASNVTLNNVTSSVNQVGGFGNGLSGVVVYGTGSTLVTVNGGTYAKNGRYGIEVFGGSLVFQNAPTCPTTGQTANGLGCFFEEGGVVPTPTQPTPTEPTPTQPTPTEPTPTQPTPTEPTSTEPSPTQPTPTEATPTPPTVVPTEATATPPAPGGSTPVAPTAASLGSGTTSQNAIIPLTGGSLIDLDCDSVIFISGIKVMFYNLCEQQAIIDSLSAGELPGALPSGFSFVSGVDIDVLTDGQSVQALPDGTGIQMDFPAGATDEYALLHWDESQSAWVEISAPLSHDQVSQVLSSTDSNELYQLTPAATSFRQALTTDATGIFVLVKK